MKVLIVDDHAIFRQGLRALLEAYKSVEVVGEAADGLEALGLVAEKEPEIVIMDISIPKLDGMEAAKQILANYPDVKVIILSRHTDTLFVDRALQIGISGYVHKDSTFDELKLALDAAERGRKYLSPIVLSPIVNSYLQVAPATGPQAAYGKLTPREKEVLHLLVKGRRRRDIANFLCISPKTVDRHRSNLMHKLNISSEVELQRFAEHIG
ncbi:MAG: response regulator transcription factor [Firmicutes bacterium]|nr:response regulator transcription factor [Bacillota bacterium]